MNVSITNPRARPVTALGWAAAYLALTKPRIIELLLVTTVPAMILAAGEWPGTWLVVAVLIGGAMSAGGANAINNYLDRDIDVDMRRTAHRPLPSARIDPRHALWFGIALGVAGFGWLAVTTNLLAAILAALALLFYVFVYTIGLKRSTPQNIVIGGAAGAVPVLVGWAAVSGDIGPGAWVLFAVIFLWTPPHFWALSLRYVDDYSRAGVPMLPVVAGTARTVRSIVRYSVLVAAASLLLQPVADVGWVYTVLAAVLGAALIAAAASLYSKPDRAMRLFGLSNVYLTLLFGAVAIDVLFF